MPTAKTCQICSKPLTVHEGFAGNICSHWRCRWRSLDAQLETHRRDAGAAVGESAAASFPIAVVPFRTCPTVPVAEEERQELLAFLQQLLQEMSSPGQAMAAAPQEPETEQTAGAEASGSDPADLLGKVCGVCEGFCCHHGAVNHAFLDQETLLRLVALHPGAGPGDAVADFIARIPPEHVKGSCVYHTRNGCKLPREMRARICSDYECRGLTDTRRHIAATSASRVFVVARHYNRIMHSAFVDESGARPFPYADGAGMQRPAEAVWAADTSVRDPSLCRTSGTRDEG